MVLTRFPVELSKSKKSSCPNLYTHRSAHRSNRMCITFCTYKTQLNHILYVSKNCLIIMQYHYVRCVPRIPHVSSQFYSASHPWKQHMWRDWNIFPHAHHTLDLPRTHYQSPVPTSKGDLRWRPSDLRWHAKSWILFNWIKRLQDISDFEAYIPYINPCLLRINASRKFLWKRLKEQSLNAGVLREWQATKIWRYVVQHKREYPMTIKLGCMALPKSRLKTSGLWDTSLCEITSRKNHRTIYLHPRRLT